jgi:hypothetical protein
LARCFIFEKNLCAKTTVWHSYKKVHFLEKGGSIMAKKMELNELDDLFSCGHDFELTESEYKRRVGKDMPKQESYIEKKSPIARKAEAYGYSVKVETCSIKVLTFIKK